MTLGKRSLASFAALSLLLSIIAIAGPLTPASANHPAGSELNCEPEADTNPTNTTHTITCQLVDAANAPVNAQPAAVTILGEVDCLTNCATPATYDGELDGDANDTPTDADQAPGNDDDDRADPDGSGAECVIPQGQSSCTFTYDRNDAGDDELTFWVSGDGGETDDEDPTADDDDSVDAVLKDWETRTATNIDCGPEQETNQTNEPHTVTCTTTDQFGDPINSSNTAANDDTAFDQAGGSPNNVQEDNTTDNNGQSTVTFTDDNPGTVTTTGCIDQNNNGVCDGGEPADDTTKTFQAGAASGLDAQPETDTNTVGDQHSITCQLFNQFGNQNNAEGTNNQTCNFEFFDGSPSDQDDNTPNTPDRACTTDASGDCTITYTSNAAGTDRVCVWLGGTTAAMTGDNTNGTCGGEGLTDPDGEDATPVPANDDQDVVQKVWGAAAGAATQVNAEPETDTNPAGNGNQHIIQVAAMSAANQPTTASPIRADVVSGPDASGVAGQAEINCAQDNVPPPGSTVVFTAPQQQTHECVLTNNGTPGTDVVRVFIDADNDGVLDQNETFDEVTKIWSGAAFGLTLTPDNDAATAGTCNEFTATVVDQGGRPVIGQNIDVLQSLQTPGNDPAENRELYFCDPTAGGTAQTGQNPATQQTVGNAAPGPGVCGAPNGTCFGDVQGNQQVAGSPGNNTAVHAEVGPTNQNGQVTFGIGIRCGANNNDVSCISQAATVSVLAWVDPNDNEQRDAGEPSDNPSTKTWNPGGGGAVTGLNAEPENASNPINTQHQVTVTITGAAGAIQGVVPNSVIVANATGRPQGDVTNPNAGASPNANATSQSNPQSAQNIYNCTPTNAQGVSTCTFTDPNNTPAGTDTIVFYVNQAAGGTPGPDANEPQDAVQKSWTPGPQNLDLDLQCAGTGTADDQDVAERNEVLLGNQNPDCTNPLSDADEVFTAIVTNPAQGNIGVAGIRVDFSFGFRANGNNAGANNSTNDATLNATPGGQVGTTPGGLLTFCTTDATGRCTVTLNNATPQAGDVIEVVGAISGATGGNPNDTATKGWQTGSVQAGTITLTPRAATNQIGTPHTVTATVRNQFGQPVQGADVDWAILAGSPNANVAPEVDDVTDANGNATFTYTSNVTGTDTIRACSETGGSENDVCDGGEPSAQANKTWQTGPVTTSGVALDMDADDNANVNAGAPGACELTTSGADPARESTATNQINPTDATNVNNFHRICAAAFQTGNQRLAGGVITFTIQGPGRIYAANANGNCATNVVPPAGTTVTVTADNNGFAFACLYSQQVGRTTVTASSGNPAQTATGTKDWTVNPNTARFIQLCHGDIAGTTCVTDQQTNEPNDEHEMTARVTDAQGNPVANVPVQFRETGPGIFTPQGGSTATVTTDANGLAAILLTSDVEGTSTIVAEIQAGSGPQGIRGAGATDDECERPAGTNNQPAAGNCISQTLTKIWDEEPVIDPECDDGLDNDGDNLVDFGEDPGCIDDQDNSELPVNTPPVRERHDRSVSIRFNDGTGARNNGLVVFGRLRAPGFPDCRSGQPVNVQRRVNGRWVTKKTTNTNRRGRYAVEIFDLASRYRAVAPRTELEDIDNNRVDICRKAIKAKRHRHRR